MNGTIYEISTKKYSIRPNFSAPCLLEFKISISKISSWRPSQISKWQPTHWSDRLDPAIFEISTPKSPYEPNFTLSAGSEQYFHISYPLFVNICLLNHGEHFYILLPRVFLLVFRFYTPHNQHVLCNKGRINCLILQTISSIR